MNSFIPKLLHFDTEPYTIGSHDLMKKSMHHTNPFESSTNRQKSSFIESPPESNDSVRLSEATESFFQYVIAAHFGIAGRNFFVFCKISYFFIHGIIQDNFDKKIRLESLSLAAFSSLNSQSKEIDIIVT